uniref:Uncharacterized protein n=1 Tax=Utricularia reniformis TaxID=192314 RepID=A0A1Y0B002_9LAMI|nr:hypothetical protein AEK19_MT0506 [Utricularia reniformis]ART30762.1 hypothetical protein AEK19_MT0506 [Utricularia reniformis]
MNSKNVKLKPESNYSLPASADLMPYPPQS